MHGRFVMAAFYKASLCLFVCLTAHIDASAFQSRTSQQGTQNTCRCDQVYSRWLQGRNLAMRSCSEIVAHGQRVELVCKWDATEQPRNSGTLKCYMGNWMYPSGLYVRCSNKASCHLTTDHYQNTDLTINGTLLHPTNQTKLLDHGTNVRVQCKSSKLELYMKDSVAPLVYANGAPVESLVMVCHSGQLFGGKYECKPARCQCEKLGSIVNVEVPLSCDGYANHSSTLDVYCASRFTHNVEEPFEVRCVSGKWEAPAGEPCREDCSCASLSSFLEQNLLIMEKVPCHSSTTVPNGALMNVFCKNANGYLTRERITCREGQWRRSTPGRFCRPNEGSTSGETSVETDAPFPEEQSGEHRGPEERPENGQTTQHTGTPGGSVGQATKRPGIREETQNTGAPEGDKKTTTKRPGSGEGSRETGTRVESGVGGVEKGGATVTDTGLTGYEYEYTEQPKPSNKITTTNMFSGSHTTTPSSGSSEECLHERCRYFPNCVYVHKSGHVVAFYDGAEIEENGGISVIPEYEQVTFRCRDISTFNFSGSSTQTCVAGKLIGSKPGEPKCTQLELRSRKNAPVIIYLIGNGYSALSPSGTVFASEGSQLVFQCKWFFHFGQPSWDIPEAARNLYSPEWNSAKDSYDVLVDSATARHSGVYTCLNPYGRPHSIIVLVVTGNEPQATDEPQAESQENASQATREKGRTDDSDEKQKPASFECYESLEFERPCEYTALPSMVAFFQEALLNDETKLIPHGYTVKYRCAEVYDDNFEGNSVRRCMDGVWSHPPPACHQLEINSWMTAPPVWVNLKPQGRKYIMADGTIIVPKSAAVHLICWFTQKLPIISVQPDYLLQTKSGMKRVSDDDRIGYYIEIPPIGRRLAFQYNCSLPLQNTRHQKIKSLNILAADVCAVEYLRPLLKDGLSIEDDRRETLYIAEGDSLKIRCNRKKVQFAPSSFVCASGGKWVKGNKHACRD